MAITEHTTVAELEHELALLGFPTITITGRRINERGICLHHRQLGFTFGTGPSVAVALEEAMRELRDRWKLSLAAGTPPPRPRR